MANFLTLLALWYSLDFGEMVQDKGTADVQRMLTARATLGRNRGGPCHEMADSIQTWAAKVLAETGGPSLALSLRWRPATLPARNS